MYVDQTRGKFLSLANLVTHPTIPISTFCKRKVIIFKEPWSQESFSPTRQAILLHKAEIRPCLPEGNLKPTLSVIQHGLLCYIESFSSEFRTY